MATATSFHSFPVHPAAGGDDDGVDELLPRAHLDEELMLKSVFVSEVMRRPEHELQRCGLFGECTAVFELAVNRDALSHRAVYSHPLLYSACRVTSLRATSPQQRRHLWTRW
jgi:hypothetical protein